MRYLWLNISISGADRDFPSRPTNFSIESKTTNTTTKIRRRSFSALFSAYEQRWAVLQCIKTRVVLENSLAMAMSSERYAEGAKRRGECWIRDQSLNSKWTRSRKPSTTSSLNRSRIGDAEAVATVVIVTVIVTVDCWAFGGRRWRYVGQYGCESPNAYRRESGDNSIRWSCWGWGRYY